MNKILPIYPVNTQPIERRDSEHNGDILDVAEMFLTIQGEGPFSGKRAIFIRLAGCNLQCPACDTDYTSDRRSMAVSDILKWITHTNSKFEKLPKHDGTVIVITGGEPFRQNITPLCSALVKKYLVQVETNGTLAPSEGFSPHVHIVCSPKTHKISPKLFKRIDSFKYVLNFDSVDPEDGLPIRALGHPVYKRIARPRKGIRVYLQPMDSKNEHHNAASATAVAVSAITYGYVAQIQIHKHLQLR